jgi:excinuclease ABC subunit C
MKFRFLKKEKINQIPQSSGVYAFLQKNKIIYIGKANNLRKRLKSHLLKESSKLKEWDKIGFLETQSEIEALILEAKLIKKYQPKYNIVWRDSKNYFFVAITKEKLPRLFITHQPKLKNGKIIYIGPFVDGKMLKMSLRYLRKVFPFYTVKKHPLKLCPWCHLKLCPGPNPKVKEYQKSIKDLIKVLKGEKQSLLKDWEKEMIQSSKKQEFEKAAKLRDQIEYLKKIIANAKILKEEAFSDEEQSWNKTEKILRKILRIKKRISRIEAYDVSNIQGKEATGSMVTFIEGRAAKNLYRRFRIKNQDKIAQKPNDLAMIKETIFRRLKHKEWPLPDLILIDGGKAQLNAAKLIINHYRLSIPLLALAKRKNELFLENQKEALLLENLPREIFNLILRLRDEAHRFAKSYHQKLRERKIFIES